jgi:branched-chain amino acid transport system permease protein
MTPRLGQSSVMLGAVVVALVAAPAVLGPYYRIVLSEVLVWGLFGMAFDLLFGYTGMLSFGQALFFGAGAYGAAFAVFRLGGGLWLSLLLAVAVATVLATAVGFFAVRVSGHYFLVLTITFSVVIFLVLQSGHWRWITGGYSGRPFPAPPIMLGRLRLPLTDSLAGYYFVLAMVALAYALCWRVLASGLGWVLLAIRENEGRTRLLGYNVEGYKLLAFALSGLVAGLSGGLYALTSQYTNLSFFHWTVSTNAVVWTVIGGTGTLLGPFVGSGLFILGSDLLSASIPNFPVVVGLLLLFFILFAPEGLLGLLRKAARARGVGLG